MNYSRSFTVEASLAEVAKFHSDTRALKVLTPPPIWMQPRQIEPLSEGSRSEFVLWLGPVPVRWVARHSQVGANGFVDEQEEGPFKRWVHRHEFMALTDRQTIVMDEISAELSDQPFKWLIGAAMWLGLPVLFAYRAWRTHREVARVVTGDSK
jgi:ligand-binding SRPBCC domain-containing protein